MYLKDAIHTSMATSYTTRIITPYGAALQLFKVIDESFYFLINSVGRPVTGTPYIFSADELLSDKWDCCNLYLKWDAYYE